MRRSYIRPVLSLGMALVFSFVSIGFASIASADDSKPKGGGLEAKNPKFADAKKAVRQRIEKIAEGWKEEKDKSKSDPVKEAEFIEKVKNIR